jgi:Autotransporter beta-domain/Protein of unknown function (DUF1254)
MNEFLLLMLNPFDSDRAGFGGAGFGAGSGAAPFGPEADDEMPAEVAAYAAKTSYYKAPIAPVPAPRRWNVWASAFGGSNNTNGDPNGTGTANFSARTGAMAAGVDYKLTPDTLVGVALAGGGTSWSLAQGLGGGHTDAFQAGLYGSQRFGAWYLSGAASFANYWASTSRQINLPAIHTQRQLQRPELGRTCRGRLSLRLGCDQSRALCGVPGAELLDAELQRGLDLRLQSVRALLRVAHRQRRPNRDTLYSFAIIDLDAGPATLTLPDAGKRYMGMQLVNQEQYTPATYYGAGSYSLTREAIGTRYAIAVVRFLVDFSDQEDVRQVRTLQDAIKFNQERPGSFEIPHWDEASLQKIKAALLQLGTTVSDTRRMFGANEHQVDPVKHLIGSAMLWGGNPEKDALYLPITPAWNYTVRLFLPRREILDGTWRFPVAQPVS